tara:strand:+ start:322 stop:456 length:135 start_codon:yes stop_codon:yes gene_type:complete
MALTAKQKRNLPPALQKAIMAKKGKKKPMKKNGKKRGKKRSSRG